MHGHTYIKFAEYLKDMSFKNDHICPNPSAPEFSFKF